MRFLHWQFLEKWMEVCGGSVRVLEIIAVCKIINFVHIHIVTVVSKKTFQIFSSKKARNEI